MTRRSSAGSGCRCKGYRLLGKTKTTAERRSPYGQNRIGGIPTRVYSSASARNPKDFGGDLRTLDEKGGRNDAIQEGSQRETGFRPTLPL